MRSTDGRANEHSVLVLTTALLRCRESRVLR